MPYIRTKDGIYEPTKWQCDLTGEMILVKADNKFGNDTVFARDIINQAETIEELCDQLLYVEDTIPKDIYPPLMNPKGIIECQIELGCTEVYKLENFKYGIWTDKGLIYVAKTNSNGELELLWNHY